MNNIFKEKSLSFLKKYLKSFTPSGYEIEGQRIWKKYLQNYVDEIKIDNYGTTFGIINNKEDYKIMIEAHVDEVSWSVKYISEDGLIFVSKNGGTDHLIANSKEVEIYTEKGIIPGVFGITAIHTRTKEIPIKVEDLFIDVGAKNKKEVKKLGIKIGCNISYKYNFNILNKKYLVSKALDNKIGGFIIAEVARIIKKTINKLPYSLYIVNSVQEEIGLRGAKMIANNIKPDLSIIIDVCPDTTTPFISQKKYGKIKSGLGPVITYSPAVHNNFRDFMIKIANKNKIKFQKLLSSIYTGTDTDVIAYSNYGIISSLISIPLKYLHTTVEMINMDDVKNTIFFLVNILKEIKYKHNFKYSL
ncbi:M42 family peptidase [Candidatus Shikimatogenerans silvanidophilus]|uniref:M42 family peptidase n=1 Tax=Candidatus Shikimatogenerans silvanidophilus TaxID=2782547 RepID=UPI001BAAD88B|nr:M42 family peptidase [Candidatus Shikimatogenerans silvanidophilus]